MNKMNDICLEFRKVSYTYLDKPKKEVLKNVSFKLRKKEILAILGKNGTGKSTILNLTSEFFKPLSGKIVYYTNDNKKLFSSIIPQEYSLFDWKTVKKNIELSLLSSNKSSNEIDDICKKVLRITGTENYKSMFPKKLSGGLKQRVAIARALAPNPSILLLDEPFNSLDISSKNILIKDIKQIIKQEDKSAIIVTHDIEEAILIADRIIIMDSSLKGIKATVNIYEKNKTKDLKSYIKKLLNE